TDHHLDTVAPEASHHLRRLVAARQVLDVELDGSAGDPSVRVGDLDRGTDAGQLLIGEAGGIALQGKDRPDTDRRRGGRGGDRRTARRWARWRSRARGHDESRDG